jgi:hypothetical protein
MNLQIKFSHEYPKLHNQKSARLLAVEIAPVWDLLPDFVEYDTAYGDGEHFVLPRGTIIVLTFAGNNRIPFTTLRSYGHQKYAWYKSQIGQTFEIVILQEVVKDSIQGKLPLESL